MPVRRDRRKMSNKSHAPSRCWFFRHRVAASQEHIAATAIVASWGGAWPLSVSNAFAQEPECSLAASLDWREITTDVCHRASEPAPLKYFVAFACQTFKMMVWPASNERRRPDRARTILDARTAPGIGDVRTFDTFKQQWELFL